MSIYKIFNHLVYVVTYPLIFFVKRKFTFCSTSGYNNKS